jgi:hypothetical protein
MPAPASLVSPGANKRRESEVGGHRARRNQATYPLPASESSKRLRGRPAQTLVDGVLFACGDAAAHDRLAGAAVQPPGRRPARPEVPVRPP